VFAALATSFRRLGPIVLEIAATHSAAFSASFGGPLAVFGKVAGPATVLRPVVHIQSSLVGSDPHRPGHRQANVNVESWFQLERYNRGEKFQVLTFGNAAPLPQCVSNQTSRYRLLSFRGHHDWTRWERWGDAEQSSEVEVR
jgi:hypothetical protein